MPGSSRLAPRTDAGTATAIEKEVLPKYKHLLDDSKVSIIDINVLLHQTPGGMLSNLVNQLREMDALDKIDEVYKELPRVRKELGQIPLVTPTSQIVGIQTVNNVLFDDEKERGVGFGFPARLNVVRVRRVPGYGFQVYLADC